MPRALPEELALDLELDEPDDEPSLRRKAARALKLEASELPEVVLYKRSIDARRGRVRFHVVVGFDKLEPESTGGPPLREVKGEPEVIVIGDGPAGLLRLRARAARSGRAGARSRQARAAAPARSQGPERARRGRRRQQLLLRRGRRRNLQRRQALHALAQARQRARRDRDPGRARRAGRDLDGRATSHRVQSPAEGGDGAPRAPRGRGAALSFRRSRGVAARRAECQGSARRRGRVSPTGAKSRLAPWCSRRATPPETSIACWRTPAFHSNPRLSRSVFASSTPSRSSTASSTARPRATRSSRTRRIGSLTRSISAASSRSACAREAGWCPRPPSRVSSSSTG